MVHPLMTAQRILAGVLTFLLVGTAGCTSMRPIRPETGFSEPVYVGISAGDTVVVQTRDGERWRFEVQEIDGGTIVARGGHRFTRNDIVQVWRRSFSGPKTTGLIVGTTAAVAVVVILRGIASALDDLH